MDALRCAALKCSAADVQAVWSERKDRLRRGSAMLPGNKQEERAAESAYLTGLAVCCHAS